MILDPSTVDPAADRDRIGEFVRRSLPRRLEALGCSWPLELSWDADHIGATLTRGELVLRAWNSKRPWWYPATKKKAIDIASSFEKILGAHYRKFADADETGRRRATVWKGAYGISFEQLKGCVPIEVELAPGVYFDTNAGTSGSLVFRYQAGGGVVWEIIHNS